MASKEEVRGLAKKAAEGGTLTSAEKQTIERTTSQAGSEGRAVTRILGGGKA